MSYDELGVFLGLIITSIGFLFFYGETIINMNSHKLYGVNPEASSTISIWIGSSILIYLGASGFNPHIVLPLTILNIYVVWKSDYIKGLIIGDSKKDKQ